MWPVRSPGHKGAWLTSTPSAATTARYTSSNSRGELASALAAAALDASAACVLLGQHAQDQAETLLLALSRGAGLPGLAGMAESFERHGACFGRPLLGVDGQALRDWLDRVKE